MPDHDHLLIWPGEDANSIGKLLLRIKGLTSRDYRNHIQVHVPELQDSFYIHKKGKRQFKFWQSGGGFDRNLWNSYPVHHSIRYIEGNPVRAGLVDMPENWRWSSAWARKNKKGLMPDDCILPILMDL